MQTRNIWLKPDGLLLVTFFGDFEKVYCLRLFILIVIKYISFWAKDFDVNDLDIYFEHGDTI